MASEWGKKEEGGSLVEGREADRGASGRAGKPPGAILPSSLRSAQYAPSGYAARRGVVVAVFIRSCHRRPFVVVGGARLYTRIFFVRRRLVPVRRRVAP